MTAFEPNRSRIRRGSNRWPSTQAVERQRHLDRVVARQVAEGDADQRDAATLDRRQGVAEQDAAGGEQFERICRRLGKRVGSRRSREVLKQGAASPCGETRCAFRRRRASRSTSAIRSCPAFPVGSRDGRALAGSRSSAVVGRRRSGGGPGCARARGGDALRAPDDGDERGSPSPATSATVVMSDGEVPRRDRPDTPESLHRQRVQERKLVTVGTTSKRSGPRPRSPPSPRTWFAPRPH